jgi:hypothetical protein
MEIEKFPLFFAFNKEQFEDKEKGFNNFFKELKSRTDISQDAIWEIECYEEKMVIMCNIYDKINEVLKHE